MNKSDSSSSQNMQLMPQWIKRLWQTIYGSFVRLLKTVSIALAYEYKNTANDNRLITTIKSICQFIHVYFPLFYGLRLLQRFSLKNPYYPFIDEITQTTTRIIFTRSQRNGQPICLKLWRRTENEVCDERLIIRNDEYLIEGLAFNKKFAPGVYLGVATVILDDDHKRIQRGPLIKSPGKEKLISNKRYALVMKTLKPEQSLDHQLINQRIDVDFLAREVAQMHRHLEQPSGSDVYGKPDRIATKLSLNNELFLEAINKLVPPDSKKYGWIGACLEDACHTHASLFKNRSQEGHIKRCHGDLKVSNLWVVRSFQSHFQPKLLALDCIDFKPEFCLIDTLSDVAMLAVDLERLYPQETELAKHFLHSYLSEMQEDRESVEPLLEYYLTEKAIVCSYVSILFDNQQHELGEKYLQIAYSHARRLQKLSKAAKQKQAIACSRARHQQKLSKAAKRKRELASQNEPELIPTISSPSLVEDVEHTQEMCPLLASFASNGHIHPIFFYLCVS